MGASENQFSLTRAASITSGAATTKFLSVVAALATYQIATAGPITGIISPGGALPGMNYVNLNDLSSLIGGGTPSGTVIVSDLNNSGTVALTFGAGASVENSGNDGLYAQPFNSGGNGAFFGSPYPSTAPDGPVSPYLASGWGPGLTINFGVGQTYLGLLMRGTHPWNTLSFYDSSMNLIESLTGSGIPGASGSGPAESKYVNFTDPTGTFQYVVFTSSQPNFEFADIAYNLTVIGSGPPTVPDNGATLPFGLTLFGLELIRK